MQKKVRLFEEFGIEELQENVNLFLESMANIDKFRVTKTTFKVIKDKKKEVPAKLIYLAMVEYSVIVED